MDDQYRHPMADAQLDATAGPTKSVPLEDQLRVNRGFDGLKCPGCGDSDGSMFVYLDDLREVTCRECDESFSLVEIQTAIRDMKKAAEQWEHFLIWMAMAPKKGR